MSPGKRDVITDKRDIAPGKRDADLNKRFSAFEEWLSLLV